MTASARFPLQYSLRRQYVDEFHSRHVPTLAADSRVLDLGGNRLHKRGRFDIERYPLRVVYANLVTDKRPDVQSDAARLPFADGVFDAVICSELLEHVPQPPSILQEVHRVLKPGGVLLICVPFLYHIHADPEDYGRYTDHYWRSVLASVGFIGVQIEKQGLFLSVLLDMLREAARYLGQSPRRWRRWGGRAIGWVVGAGREMVWRWDQQASRAAHPFWGRYTTGFGIRAQKRPLPKVYLTGGDNLNWALDDDLRLTRQALTGVVEFTALAEAEVIHSMWWEGIAAFPAAALAGKRVICHVPGEPFRYYKLPAYYPVAPRVDRWVVGTQEAGRELAAVGAASVYIPYAVDLEVFRPLLPDDPEVMAMRERWSLPAGRYLIGNFHRDTEGRDLTVPKLVKGPDLFAEIVGRLWAAGLPIHVVLAGPRRHWLRQRLAALGVPYTFIGEAVAEDDLALNALPRAQLNQLYNLLDVYLVSSRSEGGPRSIMEAAAAGCRIVSTRVGLALDILEPACLYVSPAEAVRLIEADLRGDSLHATIEPQRQRVREHHQPQVNKPLFQDLYAGLAAMPPGAGPAPEAAAASRAGRYRPDRPPVIGLWHTFFQPPYGGGNQFMLALRQAFLKRGLALVENEWSEAVDAYLLNSIHFDVERFQALWQNQRVGVVHRIDGPIHLVRGFDREKDELAFQLNARFAQATVIQSAWTFQRIVEMGYRPVNPVIVHNAVDADIFHRRGRAAFDPNRKVRLISTSWSNNPRKGGPTYQWLDEHLDWDRFEYTFVGNVSEELKHVRRVPPVDSAALAELLRQHDIYITASQNDPCSNALLEALACGLPALAMNSGGHPELIGYGGLLFDTAEEVPAKLTELVENYGVFQNLIAIPALDEVAETYLTLLRSAAEAA